MTIESLYTLYRQKIKDDPDFDLYRCRYEFGGKIIQRVTKRKGYYVHFSGGAVKVTGKERVK